LLCSSAEQMLEYLNDLPETERLKIGQRARARVLSQHSSVHRALELDRYLRALRSDRTRLLDKSVA
jgi:hypothetical protein